MQYMTKEVVVEGTVFCLYGCAHLVRRISVGQHQALPSKDAIRIAKERFGQANLKSAQAFIDAILMVERNNIVLGYFFVLLDTSGYVPEHESEDFGIIEEAKHNSDSPFLEFGSPYGNRTALGDFITYTEDPEFMCPEMTSPGSILTYVLDEATMLLSEVTCQGKA